MNWFDVLIIVFALGNCFEAFRRGFILGMFDLFSFFLSFAVSLRYYILLAHIFRTQFAMTPGIASAVGFFVIALCAHVLFSYLLSFVVPFIPRVFLHHRMNKTLGIVPSLISFSIITSFILTLALVLPVGGFVKSAISNSLIGGFLTRNTHTIELSFITVPESLSSRDRIDLHFTQKNTSIDVLGEEQLFAFINTEREQNGLEPLILDQSLQKLARSYGETMLEQGFFSHYDNQNKSPFDRMNESGIVYLVAGENLALAPSISIAHQGLMNSPGHRDNILSPDFSRVGLGVIDGGMYGKMIVEEFSD